PPSVVVVIVVFLVSSFANNSCLQLEYFLSTKCLPNLSENSENKIDFSTCNYIEVAQDQDAQAS
ncbi:1868_t:CDS:2, partial [Entrophospora sp. SA101]